MVSDIVGVNSLLLAGLPLSNTGNSPLHRDRYHLDCHLSSSMMLQIFSHPPSSAAAFSAPLILFWPGGMVFEYFVKNSRTGRNFWKFP